MSDDIIERIGLKDKTENLIRDTIEAERGSTSYREYIDGLGEGDKISRIFPRLEVVEKNDAWIKVLIEYEAAGLLAFFTGDLRVISEVQLKRGSDVFEVYDGDNGWKRFSLESLGIVPKVFTATFEATWDKEQGILSGGGGLYMDALGLGLEGFVWLSENGFRLSFEMEIPVLIPIGTTPFGIAGWYGEFAWNFKPDIANQPPNALDFAEWARTDPPPPLWVPVRGSDIPYIGVGAGLIIKDHSSKGKIVLGKPMGIVTLIPGPVVIIGGTILFLEYSPINQGGLRLDAYTVLARSNGNWTVAITGSILVKFPSIFPILKGAGLLEMFFDFGDPASWFIHVGTENDPVTLKFLDLLSSESYLMIDKGGVRTGASISSRGDFDFKVCGFWWDAGMDFRAALGLDPFSICASFALWGGGGVWVIRRSWDLSIEVSARTTVHLPDPLFLSFHIDLKVGMPWPIPDFEHEFDLEIGDQGSKGHPPELKIPLVNGIPLSEGTSEPPCFAIHQVSGKKWNLNDPKEPSTGGLVKIWPDATIIAPFHFRIMDDTGKVIGRPIQARTSGGYEITHALSTLKLWNDSLNREVDIRGLWSDEAGGENTDFLVNSEFPIEGREYEWSMDPNVAPVMLEQRFNIGDEELVTNTRTLGYLRITPVTDSGDLGDATLTNIFCSEDLSRYPDDRKMPESLSGKVNAVDFLTTRVFSSSDNLELRFVTRDNRNLHVSQLECLVIEDEAGNGGITIEHEELNPPEISELFTFSGNLRLKKYVYTRTHVHARVEQVIIKPNRLGINLFAVNYQPYLAKDEKASYHLVLNEGDYTLTLEGDGRGTPLMTRLESFPLGTVAWSGTQRFHVETPDTLIPYINFITIGDPRIIEAEELPWNPTMLGYGFPCYKKYEPKIRFLVRYMEQIYNEITVKLLYEDGSSVSETLPPEISEDGNAEIIFTKRLTKPGYAMFKLSFEPEIGDKKPLDELDCYISQFNTFRDQISIENPQLNVLHTPYGSFRVPDMPEHPISEPSEPPPLSEWLLPNGITQFIKPLNKLTGLRFARFIDATGIKITGNQRNKKVNKTIIDALIHKDYRIIALWLRTPEPIDWRRVKCKINIKNGDGVSLKGKLAIIPSPDGSSAFLIGKRLGRYLFLPKGTYTLTFTYQLEKPGLPPLRRRAPQQPSPGKPILGPKPVLPSPGEPIPIPKPGLPPVIPKPGVPLPPPPDADEEVTISFRQPFGYNFPTGGSG